MKIIIKGQMALCFFLWTKNKLMKKLLKIILILINNGVWLLKEEIFK